MKIIQISDLHLLGNIEETYWDVNPYETLSRVINHIKNEPQHPDLILLTGDLSQDDTPESYQNLVKLIEFLNIETYFIPGNHDIVSIMEQFLHGKKIRTDKLIYKKNWAIILLNSTAPGKISGMLSPTELNFLKESLNKTTDYQVLIALHHHPIPLQTKLMDQYMLENPQEFFQIINGFPQVKIVLFGHVHQAFEKNINGVTYLSCPSTWVQFRPGAQNLEFDNLAPGYRWLDLNTNGFDAVIKRVSSSR